MYYQNPNAQYAGAYMSGQPQQSDIPWTNAITDQEKKMLKEKNPDLVLVATEKELAQAKCTHRDPDRRCTTLQRLPNGSWKCTQCGAEFNIVDLPTEEIEKYVLGVIDIIQTSKLMYLNLPPATIASYFSMIPFLEKLPKLYETAQNVFKKGNGNLGMNQYQYSSNPWDILTNVVANPGYGMPAGYAAPQMNQYQYQQPVNPYYGQPAPMPAAQAPTGYYADPGFNPLQQAPQGLAPQYFTGQGYMQQPAPVQPQAPTGYAAPAQAEAQTQPAVEQKPAEGEVVKTNKQFSL